MRKLFTLSLHVYDIVNSPANFASNLDIYCKTNITCRVGYQAQMGLDGEFTCVMEVWSWVVVLQIVRAHRTNQSSLRGFKIIPCMLYTKRQHQQKLQDPLGGPEGHEDRHL